jgi:hypothetical protein
MATRTRGVVVCAGVAVLAAGGALVAAPPASASADTVVIVSRCSAAAVKMIHTITIHADGSWEQRTRAHNSAATRRRAQAYTSLYPNSSLETEVATFRSAEKALGTGLFAADTRTWTSTGTIPGLVRLFPTLRGGGTARTVCSIDSNFPNPKVVDGLAGELHSWPAQ